MAKDWLAHKKIVIIGGTDGIGLSAAIAFMQEGAKLVVLGKKSDKGEEYFSHHPDNALVLTGDATHEMVAENAIQTCLNRFGGFDGLYHVAGGSGRKFGDGPLHELTMEGWRHTLELNLTSLMLSNRAAVKYFMDHLQGGAILNMGSVLGYSPSPKYFSTHAYATCKSAVMGLSRSMAAYYTQYNIRVNVLAPGLIRTPMSQRAIEDDDIMQFIISKQPLEGGRAGIPEDLDGAAIFLLSDQAKFITGQVITVDGGWSVTDGQY